MPLEKFSNENLYRSLFEGAHALPLDSQLRDIMNACERHDIMAVAKMVCLKHSGHQQIPRLTATEARYFIEDIDLFLTAVISLRIRKQ